MKGIIIGGGIGGLATAIAIEKLGHEVEVYESAPEFKPLGAGLVLAANAVKAFGHLGIRDEVLKAGQLIPTVKLLDHRGSVISQLDSIKISSKYGTNNFAVHRADLHRALLGQLRSARLHTNKKATGCTQRAGLVEVNFSDGTSAAGDFLIAADGIHSAIRKQFLPESAPRYAGYTCWRAVVPQPVKPIGGPSETWGKGSRFGIVPITENRVYWFATFNAPQNDPAARAAGKHELLEIYGRYHEPVPELIESTPDGGLIWGDIIDLPPQEQFAFGRVVLIGDAAHATTPNMGQGACQAIEDAAFLYSLMQSGKGIEEVFRDFETIRKPRTRKVVEGSWRAGKVAQWQHPIAVGLRNRLMKLVPQSVQEKQMQFLYEVEF